VKTENEHVAITGATGGLGRALALFHACPGAKLSLCGRDPEKMEEVAKAAEEKGARVFRSLFDVRDAPAPGVFLKEASLAQGVPDLVHANAGVCRGVGEDGLEDPDETAETPDVNARGVILTALAAAKLMLPAKKGRVALVASQAARFHLPNTPAYSASKAAVRSYGFSLRIKLLPLGVRVTVASPGYLKTPMFETFEDGAMKGVMSAGEAAELIATKMKKGPREIRFPFFYDLMRFGGDLLPESLYARMMRKQSFNVKRDAKVVLPAREGNPDPGKNPNGEPGK
jgi:short-subunit dehydrogenase